MTKYYAFDEKRNPMFRILTEEDLHNEFMDDAKVKNHDEENFKVWKLVNTTDTYTDEPKYKAFDPEEYFKADTFEACMRMNNNMHEALDYFFNEDNEDNEDEYQKFLDETEWEITFRSPNTGRTKIRIPWLAHHWEVMEEFIDNLLYRYDG